MDRADNERCQEQGGEYDRQPKMTKSELESHSGHVEALAKMKMPQRDPLRRRPSPKQLRGARLNNTNAASEVKRFLSFCIHSRYSAASSGGQLLSIPSRS